MHLLHVHDRLSVRGGADIHLLSIAALQVARHRVSLVVGRVDRAAQPPPGVTLHRIPGLGGRERGAARAAEGLRSLTRRLAPDVIHLHNVLQPEVMEAAVRCGPALATVQDHRAFCPARGRVLPDGAPCQGPISAERCAGCFDDRGYAAMIGALTAARTRALRRFRAVVVLSAYMREELRSQGVEGARLRVIPPFPWSPDGPAALGEELPPGPLVLAAGRMVWAKGFQQLLEAWARARPPLPLLLVGDGPLRPTLQRRARQLELGQVHFPGWLPRPAIEALLSRAQLAVMPSLWAEPFGIAGLEAQARGVPVAAFDVGGVSDWLRPEHGWLVPAADTGALAQALTEASDPERARLRGARAARFVAEHFDPRALMARLDAVYRETLEGSIVDASSPLEGDSG
jgi:glycosyltransferase involved in cell wall biosynthesis